MKITKKDIGVAALIVLVSIPIGFGLGEVIPPDKKHFVVHVGVLVLFMAFLILLRFPAVAPKLHRNLVKGLGLKTDH